MSALDELGQGIDALLLEHLTIGPAVGQARVVPGPASAVDLYEEITRPQSSRAGDQQVNPRRILENALGALTQDPQGTVGGKGDRPPRGFFRCWLGRGFPREGAFG